MKTLSNGGAPSLVKQMRRFDVYSKVHDDYRVKTRSGGLMSAASLVAMSLLFFSELNGYLTVDVVDHIVVDTTLDQKLSIGLNITFPHLRCDEIFVDTVDEKGDFQSATGSLNKLEIDDRGLPSSGDYKVAKGECLSCEEAAKMFPTRCCNTCQELKDAYTKADIPYYHALHLVKQCRSSVGCQVAGGISVDKGTGGNIHMVMGNTIEKDGKRYHEFKIEQLEDGFNTSHVINRLDFGEQVPGMSSPLEGMTKTALTGAWMYHYYISLVPTLFEGRAKTVFTHQYAATETSKNVMPTPTAKLQGLPGVFFVYDFTPFVVQKAEKAVPMSNFLTSVCAIIGGVFTVAGIIDAMLYRGYRGFKKVSSSD